MTNEIEKKREKEQYVVGEMIRLYCRKNHKGADRKKGRMCPDCQELFDHALARAREEGMVEEGDTVVLTAGVPVGIAGTTNLLKAQIV